MVKHGQRYDALLNPSTESQQSCYENDIKRRREKNISHKVKYFVYVYCSWKNSWILLVSRCQVWVQGDLVLWKAPLELSLSLRHTHTGEKPK